MATATGPLMRHAIAAKDASEARAAYDALSIGEHPDVLEDAYAVSVAADAAERAAYLAYTDPLGRKLATATANR